MGEIGCPLLCPLTFFSPLQNFKRLLLSYQWTKIQKVAIHFLSKIARNILVIKLSQSTEIFIFFSTPAPMVSALTDIPHYQTSSLIRRNVPPRITSFSAKSCPAYNCIKYKENSPVHEMK